MHCQNVLDINSGKSLRKWSYRIYLLSNLVNKVLTDYIMRYIVIGESNPHVLTDKSIKTLFPVFKNRVNLISVSDYEDYSTRIDIRIRCLGCVFIGKTKATCWNW